MAKALVHYKDKLNLQALSSTNLRKRLDRFTNDELHLLKWKLTWRKTARKKQLQPPGQWVIWGIRSGRGFGKTLTAANWIGQLAAATPNGYFAVVAPTYGDVRFTCFEGETGLWNVIPKELIDHSKSSLSLPSITLKNGAMIRGFAGDSPERLRGPQHHAAWCDEIASWKYPELAWDNLMFGLRLGEHPQVCWTSTPKPKPFVRQLSEDPRCVLITGSTYENQANLPDTYFQNVAKYEGTNVGRQELWGELLDPEEAGFVKRSQWRLWKSGRPLPKFKYIVLSLDTAFTEKTFDKKKQENDPTACSVWGLFTYDKKLNVMLLDCWEDRLGFPALMKRVKKERLLTYGDTEEPKLRPKFENSQQRANHTGRKPDLILIEEKGSGISLRQVLAMEDILTEAYNPGGMDKLSRLHAVSPLFAHGRVWAVESDNRSGKPKTWADPLISQVCSFVGEGSIEHDDLLDTCTQALMVFSHKFFGPLEFKPDVDDLMRQKAIERIKKLQQKNPYAE
jgi:phage terminase large subunit-like protein